MHASQVINDSICRPLPLDLCVYCQPALLVVIGSALPSGRPVFACAVCLGKPLLSPNRHCI